MQCIVPLAGPDFILPDGSLKPLFPIDGEPLLVRALRSRAWVQRGELRDADIVFVLRATEPTAAFVDFLHASFPGSAHVVISRLTAGALHSALAGAALLRHDDRPVCVDLVDILYEMESPLPLFAADDQLAGLLPYFPSDDPKFSYLELDEAGIVHRTAEKQVISRHASAGTYFFRDLASFIESVPGSLRAPEIASVGGAFFLCPAYNALIQHGRKVIGVPARAVRPLSAIFHAAPQARR